jgi:hypothetical protein
VRATTIPERLIERLADALHTPVATNPGSAAGRRRRSALQPGLHADDGIIEPEEPTVSFCAGIC